jgi:hypothetical protein
VEPNERTGDVSEAIDYEPPRVLEIAHIEAKLITVTG